MLAGIFGTAIFAALSQSFSRQMFLEAEEHPALRSIGMSMRQLWGLGMLRAQIAGLAGSVIAVVAAVAVSWFMPIGIARMAEIHRGFTADWTVLSLGLAGIVVVTGLLAAWPAWRSARVVAQSAEDKPSRVADAAARAGLSPPGVSGIRLALEPGRGRSAVPVRSTVLGVAIGVAAVITSLTFASNLSHLLRTPSQYGWNWDRMVTPNGGYFNGEIESVRRAAGVDASALGGVGADIKVDDVPTTAIIMDPPAGRTQLVPVVTGRNPAMPGEVLLGAKTMRQIRKRIGDSVTIGVFGAGPGAPRGRFRIVGTGVLPVVSDIGGLGTGAVFNYSSASLVLPGEAPPPDTILIHFARGALKSALANLEKRFPELEFRAVSLPTDVANFGGVRNLPFAIAGLLAAVALTLMTHMLVSSIRRRRRDLAIMKTLGFAGRQLRATVAWQATALTVASLVIGVPLGLVAGRWGWTVFAGNLGVLPETLSPTLAVALLVPVAFLVANLVAAIPGRMASTVRPAAILRTE